MALEMLAKAIDELSEEIERIHGRLVGSTYAFGKLRNSQTAPQDIGDEKRHEGFEISLNVARFHPTDLLVKVVGNVVIVEGHHEERKDGRGYIQRNFRRRCILPKGYDPQTLSSFLSYDGVLTVSAPAPPSAEQQNKERTLVINQTESMPALDINYIRAKLDELDLKHRTNADINGN